MILIFLCGCTKSKSVIFTSLRQAVMISTLAHMWNFAPFFDFRRFLLLKNFLWVKTIHTRYLKGPPGSGFYNSNKIMAIQLTNPFLFMKTFIPPPKCRIWKSLLYVYFSFVQYFPKYFR